MSKVDDRWMDGFYIDSVTELKHSEHVVHKLCKVSHLISHCPQPKHWHRKPILRNPDLQDLVLVFTLKLIDLDLITQKAASQSFVFWVFNQ